MTKMTKKQIHESDIPALEKMPLEKAVNTLHGHSLHFHTLGLSVAYENHLVGAISATVTDHYIKSEPIRYILQFDKRKSGKQIFESTYAVLNTYLAISKEKQRS